MSNIKISQLSNITYSAYTPEDLLVIVNYKDSVDGITKNTKISDIKDYVLSGVSFDFTGNTSASCINDLYVHNLHGCSPITIMDSVQSDGSTIYSGVTGGFAFGEQVEVYGDYSHSEGYGSKTGRVGAYLVTGVTSGNTLNLSDHYGDVSSGFNFFGSNLFIYSTSNPDSGFYSLKIKKSYYEDGITKIELFENISNDTYNIFSLGHISGDEVINTGRYSHAEGFNTLSLNQSSHSEGFQTKSYGGYSHSEGRLTTSIGYYSHSEGFQTRSIGDNSHSEGINTFTIGNHSHSEGRETSTGIGAWLSTSIVDGVVRIDPNHGDVSTSFIPGNTLIVNVPNTSTKNFYIISGSVYNPISGITEVQLTDVSLNINSYRYVVDSTINGDLFSIGGHASHSEGRGTRSIGECSHSEGSFTIALSDYQHVSGQFNIPNVTNSSFIVGNGVNDVNRRNLLFVGGLGDEGVVNVSGKTITTNLQVTSGSPQSGYVLTATDNEGNVTWSSPNVIFNDITYDELYTKTNNNELVPNSWYRLTDYRSVNYLNGWKTAIDNPTPNFPSFNPQELYTGSTEVLLLQSITTNSISPIGYSETYPQDIVQYEPLGNPYGLSYGSSFGWITKRIDTEKNIEVPFDFRGRKYRRYEVELFGNIISFSVSTSYTGTTNNRYNGVTGTQPSSALTASFDFTIISGSPVTTGSVSIRYPGKYFQIGDTINLKFLLSLSDLQKFETPLSGRYVGKFALVTMSNNDKYYIDEDSFADLSEALSMMPA